MKPLTDYLDSCHYSQYIDPSYPIEERIVHQIIALIAMEMPMSRIK